MSRLKEEIEALRRSGRFDAAWYVAEYPDVPMSGMDPVEHYVRYGRKLGRSPAPPEPAPAPPQHASGEAGASVFEALIRHIVTGNNDGDFGNYVAASEDRLRSLPVHRSGTPVSIVMPTRDRAYLIGEAISSVLEQTHASWELLVCDDDSRDATAELIAQFGDPRIRYVKLPRSGAAKARNHGLRIAQGEIVAYLDSDNVWHPRYLERILERFDRAPGVCATRTSYAEVVLDRDSIRVSGYRLKPFSYDKLSSANFMDLNAFAHRRTLFELFGGFNESLTRLQDWDLVLRYLFFQDPASIDELLAVYRRNPAWGQISHLFAGDATSEQAVAQAIRAYYASGVTLREEAKRPSVTVVSWDVSRNHFSKAYNICEAVAGQYRTTLLGFRFFEDPIFPPYAGAQPVFPVKIHAGGMFPGWIRELRAALGEIDGDVLYAVKPRLPSFGLALLANRYRGKPFVLEVNDLESAAGAPRRGEEAASIEPESVDPGDPDLRNPHSQLWSLILEALVPEVPVRATHNRLLDARFGNGAFTIRNPKDEAHFDPARHDRSQARARLGIQHDEQVILFSGLLREHKGVLKLLDLVRDDAGQRRRLIFVASRHSSELVRVREQAHPRVSVLDSVDRNEIAQITAAADAVVLWLDPEFAASRYQMPFKLTDALAMKVPVIANPIGDLQLLGNDGYLRLVPFGDLERLSDALRDLRDNAGSRRTMVEAGRRLYLRQFSYAGVRANFALAVAGAERFRGVYPAAERFAAFFSRFSEAQCHCADAMPTAVGENRIT